MDKQERSIRRLLKFFGIMVDLDKEISTDTIRIFLCISKKEGQTQAEIGKELEIHKSKVSREVDYLSAKYKPQNSDRYLSGLDLVERMTGENQSSNECRLTVKGVRLKDRICSVLTIEGNEE